MNENINRMDGFSFIENKGCTIWFYTLKIIKTKIKSKCRLQRRSTTNLNPKMNNKQSKKTSLWKSGLLE